MDNLDFSLYNTYDYGPNYPSINIVASDNIHYAENFLISYDDDDANNFTYTNGSVPVNCLSPFNFTTFGTTANADEIIAVDLSPFAPSLHSSNDSLFDETMVHINFNPNPDTLEVTDDDVDALDHISYEAGLVLFNSSIPNGPQYYYWSPDHEAPYTYNGISLNPGSIYETDLYGFGGFVEVVNAQTHLGLPTGVDIDAFEFGLVWDTIPQRFGLALLFSVDDDDPLTTVDESGLLDASVIYASFLNGSTFEFSVSPLYGDIDAMALTESSYNYPVPTLSADFDGAPTNVTVGDMVYFNDLSTGNPTTWAWDFDYDGITDSNVQNPSFSYSSTGVYTVSLTVSNASGNDTETKTAYITVTGNTLLVSAGPDGTICPLVSVMLNGSVSGGTPPYIYSWAPTSTLSDPTILNPVASPVATTDYLLSVIDAAGDVASDIVTITVSPLLVVTCVGQDVSCAGGSDGSITTTVTGGSAPYTYSWSNGATSPDIGGLIAGTYSVAVIDAYGCLATASVVISEPSPIVLSFVAIEPSCFGYSDGFLTVLISGGTPPYAIQWSTGDNTATINNLVSAVYYVTITDANGCVETALYQLGQPSLLVLSASGLDVSCYGYSDGEAFSMATGGTPPYSYNWSNNETTQDIYNLIAGYYYIDVFDINFCSATNGVLINEPPQLSVSLVAYDATANGASDGSIVTTVNGGVYPYTYIWSNGDTTPDIFSLAAGWYTITVTDTNNCTIVDSAYVDEPAATSFPNWYYTQTGNNHSILIAGATPITIDGVQVQNGSVLGVFYDSLGSLTCAGYIDFQSASTSLAAWGDDPQTSDKDGFNTNEEFTFKLWDVTTGLEYIAEATYDTTFPNEEFYLTNGLSALSSLTVLTVDTHTIAINQGWNLISSYVDPHEGLLDSIFAPIVSDIFIVKDCSGLVYFPSWNMNGIGSWNVIEAYWVNALYNTSVDIIGDQVDPSITPISLGAGWDCIAYLQSVPSPITIQLASIVSNIVIVKNDGGFVYWPYFGVDDIGNMIPGKGYQIKLNSPAVLIYPTIPAPASKTISIPANNYYTKTLNTGVNMTLCIPLSAWEQLPETGDEIGIINNNDVLSGKGVYNNNHLAITIWGDNEVTSDIDGITNGELYKLRIWNNITGEKELIITGWDEGSGNYEDNGISIANKITIISTNNSFELGQNIPNPTTYSTIIPFTLPIDCDIELNLYDILGNKIATLSKGYYEAGEHSTQMDISRYSQGTYFYKLITPETTDIKKMIIYK